MTGDGSAAWHPDPTGRHEHRWWDGTRWTGMVSDGGVVDDDPAGTMVRPAVGSMLDAPSLVIDFNVTGYERDGEWKVYDRQADRPVGSMTIDHGGLTEPARYVALDPEGRLLFSVERPSRLGRLTVLVRDAQGRLLGRMVSAPPRLLLLAPTTSDPGATEVVWATSSRPGRPPLGRRPPPVTVYPLVLHDGTPLGRLQAQGDTGGLFGTSVPYWFTLDREPGLQEPLRTRTLAFVPFVAALVRDAVRHRGTDSS